MNARVTVLRGAGHTAMLSHPQEVAKLILDAAAQL
jgi:pimeloyl-ACP methyl ester carboxylesterase